MQLSTKGIVLRDYKIQEDRLLTVLTDRFGVLSGYANGANRTRSRLAASTELLCYSDLVLFKNRDRYTVDKAESLHIFFGLREDLTKLALGSYLAELMSELGPRGEDGSPYLRLLLNCLHLLEQDKRPMGQLKALYELRLLTMAGYMPNLVACRECGRYESDTIYFLPLDGELVCGNCYNGETGEPLGAGVLAAMRHIVYSDMEKLFSFSLSESGLLHLEALCEGFLLAQLEKALPTLEFFRTIRRGADGAVAGN